MIFSLSFLSFLPTLRVKRLYPPNAPIRNTKFFKHDFLLILDSFAALMTYPNVLSTHRPHKSAEISSMKEKFSSHALFWENKEK
jgi:hypothetical protein